MGRFIVRRLFSMIVVLIAISILTFLIFQAIPNGDPADRMAGRKATPETVAAIRKDWGFDKPLYVQYLKTMKLIFTGKVISYTQQVNVVDEIKRDLPATLSLAIGAGIIWLGLGIVVFIALWVLLNRTRLGALIRAGVDDAEMVEAMGINIRRVFLATSMLGASLAGLGGTIGGAFLTLYPTADSEILVFSLAIRGTGTVSTITGSISMMPSA